MRIIISILLNALSLYIGAWLLPGVNLTSIGAAIISGAILGLANVTVRPILNILTFPLTIVTLGLFLLVVNAIVILLVAWLVKGFVVDSFGEAFILGIVIAILNLLYEMLDLK